jgi:hypothetical protein
LGKGSFGRGVLLVWLWWIAGGSVVFRRVFFGAERYASFFGFIFLRKVFAKIPVKISGLPDGPPARRAVTS